MEEIKVGEYVRTNDGIIGKITDIDICEICEEETYIISLNYQGKILHQNNITKYSKNIIDLIEVGDICIMKDRTYEFDEFDCVYIYDKSFIEAIKEDVKRGDKIISILTHEQYENNCYRMEN